MFQLLHMPHDLCLKVLHTSCLQDLEIAADFILARGVPCILQTLKLKNYVKVLFFVC